jgi:gamma-glutamyltranspeptidase/glutathione hydrolase
MPISYARAAAVLAVLLCSCSTWSSEPGPPGPIQPEGSSGYTAKPGWKTSQFAVAAANPLATDAGYRILKDGGSAVDAAIAVQMVLTLVEPQSSGIGGGALLMHFDGSSVEAYDGRETAPSSASEDLFLKADGKPMTFAEAVVGGRSVGVPGAVRMLEQAHKEHGRLPWAKLFEPAIELAEKGFSVSPRLNAMVAADPYLKQDREAAAYFFDRTGRPWPVGHLLKNAQLAKVLRDIAAHGSKALLDGAVAQSIVDKVRQHPTNPGQITREDLASYQVRKREALCHDYTVVRTAYRLCGFPPPSSGAIAIGQIFGILQHTRGGALTLGADGLPTAEWLHFYTEAARLAYADRAKYVGDPEFVEPPAGSWMSLLSEEYLAGRAQLVGEKSMKVAKPGVPAGKHVGFAPMPDQPEHGTSHISIVDPQGHAVAMTTTVESAFGSRQMVRGFMLNNELTDFSFEPRDAQGQPVANRVQPGKRPRSSMSPTLVFDKATGQLVMTAGSPGGSLIIHYTAKTLWATLNWGLNTQRAIDLPNFGSVNGPTLLEVGRFQASTVQALEARGHEVKELDMTSGLQAIQRVPDGFFGGADPRREGVVMGE